MNKQQLIDEIAKNAAVSKNVAKLALYATISTISKSLSKKESVVLTGFGSFTVVKRKERTAINPRTREKIKVPAKKAVKFKAGKKLAAEVD